MADFSGGVPDFKLSGESKQVIKDILRSKDQGDKGYVTVDELGECLAALGFDPDEEDVTFLVKHMDDDGDGTLEVEEVLANIDVINYHCFYGKDLMAEFRNIDKDRDGVIRFPEMLNVLTTRGRRPLEALPARQLLDRLARQFDANFDGKFSYPEFVKIYMSDMLPYKDEIESGTFEVEQYPQLNKKKKFKKTRSSTDLKPTSSPKLQESRTRAYSDTNPRPSAKQTDPDTLPGYMRPKGAPRPARTLTATSDMNITSGVSTASGVSTTSSQLPGYMRPLTRQPRGETVRQGKASKPARQQAPLEGSRKTQVRPTNGSQSRTDYFGYRPKTAGSTTSALYR